MKALRITFAILAAVPLMGFAKEGPKLSYPADAKLVCSTTDYVVPSGHPEGTDLRAEGTFKVTEIDETRYIATADTTAESPSKYGLVFSAELVDYDIQDPVHQSERPTLNISLFRKENGSKTEIDDSKPFASFTAAAPTKAVRWSNDAGRNEATETRIVFEAAPGVKVDIKCHVESKTP